MQLRKLIERRIRRAAGGLDAAADVNAVVAANVGERNAVTHASSTQSMSSSQRPRSGGGGAAGA